MPAKASTRHIFMYTPLPTSMVRCTDNVQLSIKCYKHCNNTRNLSLCIRGSRVQASNYSIFTQRLFLSASQQRADHWQSSHLLTNRSNQTVWQSFSIMNNVLIWNISERVWYISVGLHHVQKNVAVPTWSSVQQSVMASLEHSEHLQALLAAPASVVLI